MPDRWQFLLGIACTLTCISMAIVCMAMGTDHWVKYVVDRDKLKQDAAPDNTVYGQIFNDKKYWSRYRGLYRFCYSDDEFPTYFPESGKANGDIICYSEQGYEFNSPNSLTLIPGEPDAEVKYETRNHLLRATTAAFALSLVCNLIACIVAVIGTCKQPNNSTGYSSFLCLLGFAFTVAAMAMFHHVHVMENNLIKAEDFRAGWRTMHRHRYLEDNISISFGYSYIIGWTAVALNLLACLFFVFSSCSKENNDLEPEVKPRFNYMHAPQPPTSKMSSSNRQGSYIYGGSSLHGGSKLSSMYGGSKLSSMCNSDADELYMDSGKRNVAYDLVDDFNMEKEDKPGAGEKEETKSNPVESPTQLSLPDLPEKESWYKEPQQQKKQQQTHSQPQLPPPPPSRKQSDPFSARSDSCQKNNRVPHPYLFGRQGF